MEFTTLFSLSFSLFLLMDPIGNIPVYIACLKNVPPKRQRLIIIRELLIALGIIILFSFLGNHLLVILHIDQRAIMVAGGIILFLIALKMIFPQKKNAYTDSFEDGDPFIVPLAIPLIAGPSVLAAVIIYSNQESRMTLIAAICLAWALTTVILVSAPYIKRILGQRGTVACEKLMGLLLTMIATQMFLEGIG
ncbi:MAG: MarC family protein [Chlamydiota bacterium]